MYYQSIVHRELAVDSVKMLLDLITGRNKEIQKTESYNALKLIHGAHTFYFVNDAHIDDRSFTETAVILFLNDKFYQIESLTILETTEEDFIIKSIEILPDKRSETQLLINNVPENAFANFTCGCCGQWFYGNVKQQLEYDQDNGYGICEKCENLY